MIGTGEELGVAAIGATHSVAAVTAYIQVRAQAAAEIAAENYWLFAHIARDKISRLGNFTLMPQIEPAAREQALALQFIDFTVSKNPPVKETAFRVDQRFDVHASPSASYWALDYIARAIVEQERRVFLVG
jgi:hypothetical protein